VVAHLVLSESGSSSTDQDVINIFHDLALVFSCAGMEPCMPCIHSGPYTVRDPTIMVIDS